MVCPVGAVSMTIRSKSMLSVFTSRPLLYPNCTIFVNATISSIPTSCEHTGTQDGICQHDENDFKFTKWNRSKWFSIRKFKKQLCKPWRFWSPGGGLVSRLVRSSRPSESMRVFGMPRDDDKAVASRLLTARRNSSKLSSTSISSACKEQEESHNASCVYLA